MPLGSNPMKKERRYPLSFHRINVFLIGFIRIFIEFAYPIRLGLPKHCFRILTNNRKQSINRDQISNKMSLIPLVNSVNTSCPYKATLVFTSEAYEDPR